jgi:cell division inhibitor SepF
MSVLDKFLDAIRLNDDFDDDDEFFDDDELEAMDEEKPKHRFFKKLDDDLDDDDDDDEDFVKPARKTAAPAPKASKTAKQPAKAAASSKITPMRNRKSSGTGNMEVCVIKPSSMEDTRDIADTLIEKCTVVLNLEGIDVDVAQRIIDFSSGACYSIGGSLQKISSYIFILTPANVEISGDFQEILSGAFDVPSVRTNF